MRDTSRRVLLTGAAGNTLVADAWGGSDGEPVIFLHGGGQTRHAWGGAASRVAKAGACGISVDLRGHGESDWTDTYSHTDFGNDIINIVRQISGKPVLVGASLGGISALAAQDLAHGELCRALVLVDIAPHTNPAGVERILQFMRDGTRGFDSLDEAADAVASYLRERSRPKDTNGLRKNLRKKEDGRWYWHWDPMFLSRSPQEREQAATKLTEAAKRLSVPTLLVRGGSSDVLTSEGVEAFRKLVPHAKFVDIAGAGHMVAGDRNDAFTDAILGFLRKHRKAAVA